MAFIDYERREVEFKIILHGPEGGGRKTSLQMIEQSLKNGVVADWIPSRMSRGQTRLFDFLPLTANAFDGFVTRFHLMTLPDEKAHALTRAHLLRETDGLIFIFDSRWTRMAANLECLLALNLDLADIRPRSQGGLPSVYHYNKRDLDQIAPREFLEYLLNNQCERRFSFDTVAKTGAGLLDGINAIAKLILAQFDLDPSLNIGKSSAGSNLPAAKAGVLV